MKVCNHCHREVEVAELATRERDGINICKECMQARLARLRRDAKAELEEERLTRRMARLLGRCPARDGGYEV